MTGFSASATTHRPALFGRRAVLAGMAAPLVVPASGLTAALPSNGRIVFRVMREKKHIGQHELTFTASPGGMVIAISVDIVLKFGPIPVFRYRLTGTESWRDGVMVAAEARTNNDGHDEYMHAVRDRDGMWVTGSHNAQRPNERANAERYRAPDDAFLATHWNIGQCAGPWINPQNGALLRPGITAHPPELLQSGSGPATLARRLDASGDAELSLWYDSEDQWTALRFHARDKSLVIYERA